MNGLLVRADRGNLSVTFDLSAFITDWEAARKTFVAFVAARFRELLNPRPGDFSAASPSELGEVWCKYRISGGSSTIVLKADSLALSFANIVNTDYQIIVEVVRGTMERLLPALQGYERHSYMVSLNYHVHVVDGRSDTYLAHHGSHDIGNTARDESTIEYRPTIGFTLRTRDGYRVLRRTIEQSEALQNGLFISDQTFVSMPTLTEFEEELSWIKRTTEFADRTARSLSGLTRNWREGKPSRWFWPTQHASVPGSGLGLRDFEGGSVAGVALLLPRAVLGPARALFRAR